MTAWHLIPAMCAIVGVILNNHKRIEGFYFFIISNTSWMVINYHHGIVIESWQNAVFLALAFHGWWKWRKLRRTNDL
jgi:nicotinamide riboside transporter PnuC